MQAGDLYRTLWRRKFMIAVLTASLVAVTWYLTSRQTPVYEASTLVRIQQQVTDPSQSYTALATGQKLAQTYADIAEATTIAERIHTRMPNVPLGAIRGHIQGRPVQDLDLLWISAISTSPHLAAQIARAAPDALSRFIDETGTMSDRVIVVQQAQVPTAPTGPRLKRNLALALFGGLVLNSGLALLLSAVRDPVGGSDELERMGIRVLASVPSLRFVPVKARPAPDAAPLLEQPRAAAGGTGSA